MSRGLIVAIAVVLVIIIVFVWLGTSATPATAPATAPTTAPATAPATAPSVSAPVSKTPKTTRTSTAPKPTATTPVVAAPVQPTPVTKKKKKAAKKPAKPKPAKPKPAPKPAAIRYVTLYADPEYKGKSVFYTVGRKSLDGTPLANAVSSVQVPQGLKLVAYDKKDCTGKSITLKSNTPDLKKVGLNNDIACVDISEGMEGGFAGGLWGPFGTPAGTPLQCMGPSTPFGPVSYDFPIKPMPLVRAGNGWLPVLN